MGEFPSGQRGQTVNLLATLSKVRILPHPLKWISRDGAVWKLVGLITRRSQVQILLPQLLLYQEECFIQSTVKEEPAQIAQLVEQRTENPCVAGSIPALGIFSFYGPLAQAVEHLTFNQVVRGSSPRWLTKIIQKHRSASFFISRHK